MLFSLYQVQKISSVNSGMMLKRNLTWPQMDAANLETTELNPQEEQVSILSLPPAWAALFESPLRLKPLFSCLKYRSYQRPLSTPMTFGEFAIAPPLV